MKANPPKAEYRHWSDADVALLGTMPDKELSEQIGRTRESIRVKRKRLRTPAVYANGVHQWTGKDDWKVRKWPVEAAAALIGVSVVAVRTRRRKLGLFSLMWEKHVPSRPWSPDDDAVLGTVSDKRAMELLKRNRGDVRKRRAELGIGSQLPRWQASEVALLGKLPDGKLALQLGRTVKGVMSKREELGIAMWRRG